jgi:hypothetical protein
VPGVGGAQDLGDGGLPVDHQPVDPPQYIANLAQVVLRGQPGARDQSVIVGTTLAVHQDELDGRGRRQLAEEVGDEHRLAEPGQPRHDHAGDLGQADHDQGAVLGPPQPPGGQGRRGRAGQVDPCRRQERVAVQATELDPAGALLGGPDRDAPPGVSQVADDVLVVTETGAWDGGHRRGHALVVDGEVGGGEAVLAGPLVLVAEPQGLGQ